MRYDLQHFSIPLISFQTRPYFSEFLRYPAVHTFRIPIWVISRHVSYFLVKIHRRFYAFYWNEFHEYLFFLGFMYEWITMARPRYRGNWLFP